MKSEQVTKKLILALVLALAACAGETRVLMVTATPRPPTTTPKTWDATVSALATSLRQLPHLNSQVMKTLPGGTKVDLLAIAEDKEWVQVIAYLEGASAIEGWLQVDKLRLNVSLDDLEVVTETVFVPPPTRTPEPTRTPGPTEVPLSDRYAAWLIEQEFEYFPENIQYMKNNGRGLLLAAALETGQMVGYASINPMTPEEIDTVRAHLRESGEFLDPGHGWGTIFSALEAIVAEETVGNEFPYGTIYIRSARGVNYQVVPLTATSSTTYFIFLNDDPNPLK